MPSYHSVFTTKKYPYIADFPLIDFETNKKPALDPTKIKKMDPSLDIIDESLTYFRANVLFANFPIKSDADKVLIYITIFTSKCLESIYNKCNDQKKSLEILKNLIVEADWNPTMKSHFLNNLVKCQSQNEVSNLQAYLKSIREEVVYRLNFILFEYEGAELTLKHWMCFAKRKFLGYDMPVTRKIR